MKHATDASNGHAIAAHPAEAIASGDPPDRDTPSLVSDRIIGEVAAAHRPPR